MQQPQGGFGLWAASNPYEAWLSAYVSGFLQDAKSAGFAVPDRGSLASAGWAPDERNTGPWSGTLGLFV